MTSSSAFSLLGQGADDAEVLGAVDKRLLEALPAAYVALGEEMAPPQPHVLVAGVTAFVGLVGQGWTAAGRAEFITLAVGELADLPGAMVMDALARARRRVTDGRFLVSWIVDDVEPRAARLAQEQASVQRLMQIATPD